MYEPEATFSPRPDQNLKGHDAIRSGLTEIAASGTELSVEVLRSSRPATQRV
ncbi:MAG: hypothetical protein ACRDMH_00165 [Solirubrobacterales bacterium]